MEMLDHAISHVWLHFSTYHLMPRGRKNPSEYCNFWFCQWGESNPDRLPGKWVRYPLHHCLSANQHCYWVAHSSILVKHSLLIWISLACHVGLVLTWSSSMTSVLIPQSLASSQRFFILRVDSNDSSVTWLHFSCRDSSSVSGGPSSSAWGCPDILARGRGTSSRTNARIQLLLQPFISCWLITVEFETRRTTNFVCAGKKRKINFCY